MLTTDYSNETGAANPSATASEKALNSDGTITIINTETARVELPATGGPGTMIYTVAGLMLITLAGVLMISRRKKYNR